VCFESEDGKKFSLMQLYQHIDNTPVVPDKASIALVEMALFSTSSILASLQELYNSDLAIEDEVVQSNKNISYLAHINLKNPGNLEVRNINECLALLCPSLSETIKDNILKFKGDEINEDRERMESILQSLFNKDRINSLDELDLMIRLLNTKYPTNKFLMVPDVRLKSGIDNIDLFLKDMLCYRISPYLYREFDWKPIGRVNVWKDIFVNSSNLIKRIQGSSAYDYLYNLNNILVTHFATLRPQFDTSKKYLEEIIRDSTYDDQPVQDLLNTHTDDLMISGSKGSRLARTLYLFAKLGLPVPKKVVGWYENQDFPIEYTFDRDNNVCLREGTVVAQIHPKTGIKIYCDTGRCGGSLTRFVWICQMIYRGEMKEDVFHSHIHSFLGKGSLFSYRETIIMPHHLVIMADGFRSGCSGCLKMDIASWVTVTADPPPKLTGFNKVSLHKFYRMSSYTVNTASFRTRNGIISLNDFNGVLKVIDLDMCRSSHISYSGNLMFRSCSISELITLNYFDRDNMVQIAPVLKMNVNRSFCGDVQGSSLIKQRLDEQDLKSLDYLFANLAGEYYPESNKLEHVSSKDIIISKDDEEARFDDMVLVSFDEVDSPSGMIAQRKTSLPWQEFEENCTPRLKAKLYNHYVFGKTAWIGASYLYFDNHTKMMEMAMKEEDKQYASLLKLLLIMMTLSKLNVVETHRSYLGEAETITKLLNFGGLGRKSKFWADVFKIIGVHSYSEYL
jgi:hypothetical protein